MRVLVSFFKIKIYQNISQLIKTEIQFYRLYELWIMELNQKEKTILIGMSYWIFLILFFLFFFYLLTFYTFIIILIILIIGTFTSLFISFFTCFYLISWWLCLSFLLHHLTCAISHKIAIFISTRWSMRAYECVYKEALTLEISIN